MAEDSDSNTEAPTAHRLAEARQKGDVPKSPDVASFATLAGAGTVVILMGGTAARLMTDSLLPFIARPDSIDLSGTGGVGVMRATATAVMPGFWVLGAAVTAGVAANVLQQGFIWAPSKLVPDPSRLSPMKGLERLFGIDGFVHFLKSLAKVTTLGFVAWMIVKPHASTWRNLSALDLAALLPFSAEIFKALMIAALVVLAVIALADFLWQRQRFSARMRMSKEEVKEETRNSEGDPHIKAKLRQLRMQRQRRRMIQSVPKATIVVMNPTHYAVALRYVQGETAAPVCVAKGLDALALKIREIAEEHRIPVVEDPPLARALFAAMEVDDVIPKEHFQAVAKIIGFVMGRNKARPPAQPRPAGLRPSRL
jgi:flagellar biosynthetic protein FlhB